MPDQRHWQRTEDNQADGWKETCLDHLFHPIITFSISNQRHTIQRQDKSYCRTKTDDDRKHYRTSSTQLIFRYFERQMIINFDAKIFDWIVRWVSSCQQIWKSRLIFHWQRLKVSPARKWREFPNAGRCFYGNQNQGRGFRLRLMPQCEFNLFSSQQ